MGLRETAQELRELGISGTLFRVRHELRMRTGAAERFERPIAPPAAFRDPSWIREAPFSAPGEVREVMRSRLRDDDLDALRAEANLACEGRIKTFGGDVRDYGRPVDWYLQPDSGQRWNPSLHWSRSLTGAATIGDPKLTWEAARFPQAYHIARAAAFTVTDAPRYLDALASQVEGFLDATPHPRGLHWFSSQELEIRIAAWTFAARVFDGLGLDAHRLVTAISRHAWEAAHHTERELEYARRAVYNNHLIAEALGLYLFAQIVAPCDSARRWSSLGRALLDEQAERQFYEDGAYLNLAHNYHRTVLHDYLLASRISRWEGTEPSRSWTRAMERSLDFLVAQQNPLDGRLPNYGSNDGSMPRVLSTCDFSDMRPTLQAVSVLTRGERLYPEGPWDEECAWIVGADALSRAPLRPTKLRSMSFAATGFHALRGEDPSTFSVLRCGTVRDRFGQIDMLHLDVWWRGLNVLVDGGTWLYNGRREWLEHFLRTASHNTVTVDGRDQMLHWRQFKFLYWTRAKLLAFEDRPTRATVTGEHSGYARLAGRCVHRRAVLFAKDDLVVVIDRISGEGRHSARLHWLTADHPFVYDAATATLTLSTPRGEFSLATFDERGSPAAGDVVRGGESPPRGWLSRRYANRAPTPSLAVVREGETPITLVTVMGAGPLDVSCSTGVWNVRASSRNVRFRIEDGMFADVKESLG